MLGIDIEVRGYAETIIVIIGVIGPFVILFIHFLIRVEVQIILILRARVFIFIARVAARAVFASLVRIRACAIGQYL